MSSSLPGCAAADLCEGNALLNSEIKYGKCVLPRKSKAWFSMNSGSRLTC